MSRPAAAPFDEAGEVEALRLLGHGLRLAIMRRLAASEQAVGEIAALTGQNASVISQQLAMLRRAGLVRTRRDAKQVFYTLDHDRMRAIATALQELAEEAPGEATPPRGGPAVAMARPPGHHLGAAMFARVGPGA